MTEPSKRVLFGGKIAAVAQRDVALRVPASADASDGRLVLSTEVGRRDDRNVSCCDTFANRSQFV